MDDLYAVLGVARTASAEEIKKAYREAAFKYHPDRNAGNKTAEDMFKKVNAAYDILGDKDKRARYDGGGYTDPFSAQSQSAQTSYSEDPFDAWFGSSGYGQRTSYTYSSQAYTNANQSDTNYTYTRAELFSLFLRSVLTFCLGLFFFGVSFIFFPIGPIISVFIIANGAVNTVRALKLLFTTKS